MHAAATKMFGLQPITMCLEFIWQAISPSQLAEVASLMLLSDTSANLCSSLLSSKGFIMVMIPSGVSAKVGATRFHATFLLAPIAPQRTRLTYVFQLNLGTRMAGLRRFFSTKRLATEVIRDGRCLVTHTMRHFQQRLPLAALENDDARRLADALFAIRSVPSMLLPAVTERVSQRMDECHALQELVTRYQS